MSTLVDRVYTLVRRGKEGRNIGLSTGIEKLDKTIFGLQRRSITIIGGPTAGGKSALAYYSYLFRPLMDLHRDKIKNCWFLIFSFEISAEVLYAKLLSLYIQEEFGILMGYRDILSLTRSLTDEGEQYIIAAREWLEMVDKHVAIIDKPMNAEGIDAALRQFTEQFGTYSVDNNTGEEIYTPNDPDQYIITIMDHLALVDQRPLKTGIDEAAKAFIYYRNKAAITGVLLQQLNRNGQTMDRRNSEAYNMPDLSDFQDSSGSVQAAEFVIAIYDAFREKRKTNLGYDLEQMRDSYRALTILKNRIGESNKAFGVGFQGYIGKWINLPPAREITDYAPYIHPEGQYLKYPDENATEDEVEESEDKVKFSSIKIG